jgi:hypothetical protein
MWVKLPEVAVTVAVYVPAGVPVVVWETEELLPPHPTHVSIASITTGTTRMGALFRFRNASQLKLTSSVVHANVQPKGSDPGGSPMGKSWADVVEAVVPTFTVTDCAEVPLICSEELDRLHVGPRVTAGVTTQPRFTDPLNVPDPARLRLKLAVCPALTVCDVVEDGLMLKSGAAWTARNTAESFTIDPVLA